MSAPFALSISLLIIGALGCGGSTFIFPLLARWNRSSKLRSLPGEIAIDNEATSLRIAILIPAHNEESSLGRTLKSVRSAIAVLMGEQHRAEHFATRVIVGANGCTDNTLHVAKEHGVECAEFPAQGKWKTLVTLINLAADADWIVFADSGVVWPSDLLQRIASAAADNGIVAYAPSYIRFDAKPLERLSWWLERQCKGLECAVGGPISLHGATIAYRGESLRKAISELNDRGDNWLNDDVVVPLMVRTLRPQAKIVYDSLCLVSDPEDAELAEPIASESERDNRSHDSAELELRRRQRMAKGNLQWIGSAPWTGDRTVRLLAYRRIARMMWAYWLLALGIGFAILALNSEFAQRWPLPLAAAVSFGGFFSVFSGRLRAHLDKAVQAARASLLVPVVALKLVSSRQNDLKSLARTSWK